jgi:hypothetical protein
MKKMQAIRILFSRSIALAAALSLAGPLATGCANFDANSVYAGLLLNGSAGSSSGTGDPLKAQGWTKRLKINIDNSAGTEAFSNFPVLVFLNGTRISYADTQDTGADARFALADGTLLDYQIERWNESGTSTAWVKIPAIAAASNSDAFYFYYGNPSATAAETASSLWSDSYLAVWHFIEDNGDPAPQFKDSTSNAHHGTATSMGAAARTSSLVGYGQNFVGAGHINVSDSAGLRLTNDFTLEALINWNGGGGSYGYIMEKGQNDNDNYAMFFTIGAGKLSTEYHDTTSTYRNPAETGTSISAGSYIHAAITYDLASLRFRFYKNGSLVSNVAAPGGNAILGNQAFDLRLGRQNFGGANFFFNGIMDEVAISGKRRSDEYLLARNKSFRDTFLTYGTAENL